MLGKSIKFLITLNLTFVEMLLQGKHEANKANIFLVSLPMAKLCQLSSFLRSPVVRPTTHNELELAFSSERYS